MRHHGFIRYPGRPARVALGAALALATAGCGPSFDPPTEVTSLRVLGVQKSTPYARPDSTVELSMLWADGSEAAPRPVHRVWLGGCDNPAGDLYYGCFAQGFASPTGRSLLGTLAATLAATGSAGVLPRELGADFPPGIPFAVGDRFLLPIPSRDAMITRPAGTVPAYGLTYVFFAACAGTLELITDPDEVEATGFPLGCVSDSGERVGADDFVIGYSAIYVFDELDNLNPVIDGFVVGGRTYEPTDGGTTCIDGACIGVEPPRGAGDDCTTPEDCGSGRCTEGICAAAEEPDCELVPCIEPCERDGRSGCDSILVHPVLDPNGPANSELEPAGSDGDARREQLWVNYHVDRGGVADVVRLIADSAHGWDADHGTELWAPEEPGPLRVWAVVRDNRGGVGWVRQTIYVR
ncbi:MAG: hypothetical protein JW751_17115 [Polyangiaceae bacterium]|nr:hypothetical protein [Polyangiaceae bacterium]